jgi:2-phosphoglycerate kinase
MSEPRRHNPVPLGSPGGPPYSKGLMARALMATGFAPEPAYVLARRLEREVAAQNGQGITLEHAEEVAEELFGQAGRDAVERLRRYSRLQELDVPIVLMIGGATGTGKSTIATEAAYRLGITRVTSTDFIRQTMRAFFSKDFMPSVHLSSFEARVGPDDTTEGMLPGFMDQTRNVLVGVRASLERALHEGWSMVIEGVHLVPGMLPPIVGPLVVQCIVAIDDEEEHLAHFHIRDATSEGVRPLEKYVSHFADIRALQDYIVERARRNAVPVVENRNAEEAVAAVIELVLDAAEQVQRPS